MHYMVTVMILAAKFPGGRILLAHELQVQTLVITHTVHMVFFCVCALVISKEYN